MILDSISVADHAAGWPLLLAHIAEVKEASKTVVTIRSGHLYNCRGYRYIYVPYRKHRFGHLTYRITL